MHPFSESQFHLKRFQDSAMSAAERDGQPQAHRSEAEVRQEHPEDHPVHEDGKNPITF